MALTAIWVALSLSQPGPLTAEVTPAHLVSGSGQVAEITVTLPEGLAPASAKARPSAGTVSSLAPLAGQRLRLSYEVPKTKFPQVVLIGLFAPAAPAPIAYLELPVWGAGTLTAKTRPGAEVFLEVEAKRFGPVTAAKDGSISVAFEAPPGITTGTWIARDEAGETRRPAPLKVPPLRPLVVVTSPERLLADGQAAAQACALATAGVPVTLTAEGGTLGPSGSEGAVTCASLRAPSSEIAARLTVTARADFPDGEARAEATVELSGRPAAPRVPVAPPAVVEAAPAPSRLKAQISVGPALVHFAQRSIEASAPNVGFDGASPSASIEAMGFATSRVGLRAHFVSSRFALTGDTGSQQRPVPVQTLAIGAAPTVRLAVGAGTVWVSAGYAYEQNLGFGAEGGQLIAAPAAAHLVEAAAGVAWPIGPLEARLDAAGALGLAGERGGLVRAAVHTRLWRGADLGVGYAYRLRSTPRPAAALDERSQAITLQLGYEFL